MYADFPLEDGSVLDGTWRAEPVGTNMLPLEATKNKNPTLSAKVVRDIFADYFVSEAGSVSWQWQHI